MSSERSRCGYWLPTTSSSSHQLKREHKLVGITMMCLYARVFACSLHLTRDSLNRALVLCSCCDRPLFVIFFLIYLSFLLARKRLLIGGLQLRRRRRFLFSNRRTSMHADEGKSFCYELRTRDLSDCCKGVLNCGSAN